MAFVSKEIPALIESFKKAGLVPPETVRIIVDIPLEMPVKLYYECFAPSKLADIDLGALLRGKVEPFELGAATTKADDKVVADIIQPPDVVRGDDRPSKGVDEHAEQT